VINYRRDWSQRHWHKGTGTKATAFYEKENNNAKNDKK
jgi:uncharacterized protein YodC (DUF2158 family)